MNQDDIITKGGEILPHEKREGSMNPRKEGVSCANKDCTYNDARYEQNCKATTRAHGPWVVGCNQYSPDPEGLTRINEGNAPCAVK